MSLVLLNLESNQEIELEKGNPFIIGRKNVKGCLDKRVSRSHGKITWTLDGKIHVVALHNNPCFYTRNGAPPVLQLIKNEEEFLKEGDCVGLLSDSFWFEIKRKQGESNKSTAKDENRMKFKLGNNEIQEFHIENKIESTNGNSALVNSEIMQQNVNASAINSKTNLNSQSLNLTTSNSDSEIKLESDLNTSSSTWKFGNPEFEKTRRLPLWMYEVEEPIKNNLNIEVTFRSKIADSKANEPVNKKIKLEQGDEFASTSATVLSTFKDEENSLLQPDISLASEQSRCSPNKTTPASKVKTPEKKFKSDDEDSKLGKKDISDSSKRPFCLYDSQCYRKNPQHKLEFCHPGDEDYIPYEERPLCQYGESCYRQNKMHRVEFRHSQRISNSQNSSATSSHSPSPRPALSPLPPKRRRKTLNRVTTNDEDDDEYDLEDPFINDASSDEYVPSEIDNEEEMEILEDSD